MGRGDEAGFESLAFREFLHHRLPFLDDAENALAADARASAPGSRTPVRAADLPLRFTGMGLEGRRSSSDSSASIMAGMALAICCSAK